MATEHGLRGQKLKDVKKACNYLENNLERMRYDEYLAAGYPIASGVIEGACRHLVKDRMERTGMRWREPARGDVVCAGVGSHRPMGAVSNTPTSCRA